MNKIINIIKSIIVLFCMILIPFRICVAEENPVIRYYTCREGCALPDEIYIPLFIHEVQLPKSYYQYADITVEDESIMEVDDTNGIVTVKKNGTTKMFIQFLDDPTFGNNCFTYTVHVIPAKIKWSDLEYDKYEYDFNKGFMYWSLNVDLIDEIISGPSVTYEEVSRYYEVLNEMTKNMVNVKSSNPDVCSIHVAYTGNYGNMSFNIGWYAIVDFLKPGKTELTFSISDSEYFEPLEKKITLIVHEDKTTEISTTEELVTEEPTTEEPVTEEPTTKEPVTEEPTTKEPVIEEPTTEEPVTEEPTTEEPVTEEPTTKEPVTEVPTSKEHIETVKETETNKEAAVITENTSGNNGLKKSLIIIFAVIIALLFGFFLFIIIKQQILIKKIRMQDVENPVSPENIGEETDGERTELSMYTETKISDN